MAGSEVDEQQLPVQDPADALAESDRLLRQREDELRQLRQEHLRLAGRLWIIESELLSSKKEPKRTVGVLLPEAETAPPAPSTPLTLTTRHKIRLCPYLASYTNRAEQHHRPSNRQVCYAIGHDTWAYGPADLEVQKEICLRKSVYPRCPRYQDARSREVGDQQAAAASKPWWRFWRRDP
ncbi:MAG: hypothetical protein EPO21_12345 [Chloroflexota bacterium]|nr:MAG: hypothetical protein EPO21_12345 [Chloroflexota bacterium]